MNISKRYYWILLALSAIGICLVLAHASNPALADEPVTTAEQPVTRSSSLARGISVAAPTDDIINLGYQWMKVYDPPTVRPSSKVLYRYDVDVNDYFSTSAMRSDLYRIIDRYGDNIDAYEIGNEVNLRSEWRDAPSAFRYAITLCSAYRLIKDYDPSALVVSAGLAPTGRVEGTFDGHFNHDGFAQDEREFLTEFIISGGHNCADAIGFHPMGFRADFDAAPDLTTSNPETNCDNGLCFRTVEKFYAVLVERGLDYKNIWATEVGWLVEPPASCLSTPSWQGREWQIVSADKQQSNLIGAVDYAEDNYPWMTNLVVFNYNFNQATWYDTCEQMRYYSSELPIRDFTSIFLPIIAD